MSHQVYLVDDDAEVRDSVRFLLSTLKIASRPFASGEEFLHEVERLEPGCVLLDVTMPGADGFEVQQQLAERDVDWPVIFMTGRADVPMVVRAVARGATEFIVKPFRDEELLNALHKGFVALKQMPQQATA